jgi:hypothetical protein
MGIHRKKRMIHANITNIPKNPRKIYDEALSVSFQHWIDEKGTISHPDVWRRHPSDLTYEEAFEIVQSSKPHWVISFRNVSYISKEEDYWEFGGCNIGENKYGEVFIWIKVTPDEAHKIFKKYKLNLNYY